MKQEPKIIGVDTEPTRVGGAGRQVWELISEKDERRDVAISYTGGPGGPPDEYHTRESDEYIFYLSGNPEVTLEGGPVLRPRPNELLHIPAGISHKHGNPGPGDVVQLFVRAAIPG